MPLADSRLPVDLSLSIVDGLHARWTALWRSLTPSQFARVFHHPEIGVVTLDGQLQMYAWHSRHHVAHITSLRQREFFATQKSSLLRLPHVAPPGDLELQSRR